MLKEALPRTDKSEWLDLQNLVERIKSGDQEAAEALYDHLQGKLTGFFLPRWPKSAEDLTADSLAKVFGALGNFDPSLGKRDYSGNFSAWVFTIAKNTLRSKFRKASHDLEVVDLEVVDDADMEKLVGRDQPSFEPIDLSQQFRQRIFKIISVPRQRQVVELKLQGKKNREIVEALKVSEAAVKTASFKAREKIEKELIFPAGYKRLPDFDDSRLNRAAADGRLETVQLLGRYYATPEAVSRFRMMNAERFGSDDDPDKEDLQLARNVSSSEYVFFAKPKFRCLLIRHRGKFYISPANLRKFREETAARRLSRQPRIASPGPPYERLISFSMTSSDYGKLYVAARSGKLEAVKVGRWWFTTKEAVERYLNSKHSKQG